MDRKPLKVNQTQLEMIHDYAITFTSPSGKRVLEDLEAEYGGESYVRGDLYETLHRTSCRDLLERIKEMLRRAESGLEVEEEQKEE